MDKCDSGLPGVWKLIQEGEKGEQCWETLTHQPPSVSSSQSAQPGSQGSGSTPRDTQPTLARGTLLLTPYTSASRKNPSTLEKAFRYSNLQQELGGRVPRGISVLTIEHSGQRPRVGSQVNSCLGTCISAGPFPFLGEVSCLGWFKLGFILTH